MFLSKAFVAGMMFLLIAATTLFSAIPCHSQTFLGGPDRNPVVSAVPILPLRQVFHYQAAGETISSPVVADGRVFFGCRDQHVYAVSAVDGHLLWKYRTRGAVDASAAVVNGIVYIGSQDGSFYALRAADGQLHFRHDSGSSISSSALVTGGRVYFTTETGQELRCLDGWTGDLLWTALLEQPSQSSPSLAGETVIVGDNSGRLYGFDRLSGTPRFVQTTTGSCGFVSAGVHGTEIHFTPGILDRNLYSWDFNGNPLWVYSGGPTGIQPAPAPGTRLGFSHQQRLRNLDRALTESKLAPAVQGAPARPAFFLSYVDPNLLYNSQGTAADENRIYYVSGYPTARLLAVDKATRVMSWNLVLGNFPDPVGHYGAPLLTPAGLLVTDAQGTLLIVDAETGTVLERRSLSTPSYSTLSATADRVFCLTHRGLLIGLGSGPDPNRLDDLTPPTIQVLEPQDGTVVTDAAPRLRIQMFDGESGINFQSLVLKLDGQTTAVEISELQEQVVGPLPTLADGPHQLDFSVADHTGNIATRSWTFDVQAVDITDVQPPTASQFRPAPDSTVQFNRRPEISCLLTDEGGSGLDIREIRLSLDGKYLVHGFDPLTGRLKAWPGDPLADGIHRVAVDAWDQAGNIMRTERWVFTLTYSPDSTLPAADLIEPAPDTTVTRTRLPRIVIQLADDGAGIDRNSLVLRVDDVPLDISWDPTSGQLSATPASALTDGPHMVKLFASDEVGNTLTRDWWFHVAWRIGNGRIRASLTNDGAWISWTSEQPSRGRVEISETDQFLTVVSYDDVRGADYTGQCHAVAVNNLAAGETRWFRVISRVGDAEEVLSEGLLPCSFQVPEASPAFEFPLQGQVSLDSSPAAGCLVYLTAETGNGYSLPLTTISDDGGGFTFNLAALRGADGVPLTPSPDWLLRLFVQGADAGIAWAQIPLTDPLPATLDAGTLTLASTLQIGQTLPPGLNLFGMSFDPSPVPTSYELLTALVDLAEVIRHDAASQTASVAARLFGAPAGEDFPMTSGNGFFLHFLLESVLVLTGTPADAPRPVILQQGLNLLAFPFAAEGPDRPILGMDARELIEAVPQISEIYLFDETVQRFVSAVFRLESSIRGDTFPLNQNQGYFIRAISTAEFTPRVKSRFTPTAAPAAAPAAQRMTRFSSGPANILRCLTVNHSPRGCDLAVLLDRPARVRVENGTRRWVPREGQNHIARHQLIPLPDCGQETLRLTAGNGDQTTVMEIPPPIQVPPGIGIPRLLTGRLLGSDNSPLSGRTVILTIRADGRECLPVAARTDGSGTWYLPLTGIHDRDGNPMGSAVQQQARITLFAPEGEENTMEIPLAEDSPMDCGTLYVSGEVAP